MRICLFEDARAADLEPLALTRPVFDLICGRTSLARKQVRMSRGSATGAIVRGNLADLYAIGHPETPINDLDWLKADPVMLINGRWLPPHEMEPLATTEPHIALCDGQIAYAVVGPDQLRGCELHAFDTLLAECRDSLPSCDTGGQMINHLWDLVNANADQLIKEFDCLPKQRAGWRPADCHLVGSAKHMLIDSTARLEPEVVIDTRNGPVVIDRAAVVQAFTRLEGPCYIGPHTHLFGARVRGGTTFGPSCRIGGEVECSIVHGFTNKYHEGFLGHSYLGEWVNFGAGTHTSDLRFDYGEVTVTVNGRRVNTGQIKIGAFVGDHTKTALSVLLNTGSVIGAFAHLLPSGELLPRRVPSFAKVQNGRILDTADLEELFTAAEVAMERRGQTFNAAMADFYRNLFDASAAERRQMVREAEQRRLAHAA